MFQLKETRQRLKQRGERLHIAMDRAIAQSSWSEEKLQNYQWQGLKTLVECAYNNVPFYHRKYDAAGFHPRQLKSMADLETIPMLTKEDLRTAGREGLARGDQHVQQRWLQSSGSTGVPIGIYRDEESLWSFMAQNTALYYQWCKEMPIESVLYFLDMSDDSIDYALADLLRTVTAEDTILSVSSPVELHLERLMEMQPEFVSSYPSTMRNLSLLMRQRGMKYERLKLVHLTSEMLDEKTRRLLATVFPNARIVETYTSTECGLIAWECLRSRRWHLAEAGVIAEISKQNDKSVETAGKLIVTDLTNGATPIIRYSGLGDLCTWDDTPCPCGSPLRSLAQIQGRQADALMRSDGTGVSPFAATNALDAIKGISQYQVVQCGFNDFIVLIVADPMLQFDEKQVCAGVQIAISLAVRENVQCEVLFVRASDLKTNRHKVPLVICQIQDRSS